jgi:alkyldihydroxyacetonephosphate synthase
VRRPCARAPAGAGARAPAPRLRADHPVDAWPARALEICRAHGGRYEERAADGGAEIATWREAFLRMPYLRDLLVRPGVFTDTFESAVT